MKKIVGYFMVFALLIVLPVVAQSIEFDRKKLHIGTGLALNTFSSGTALGYQWLAGYDLSEYVALGRRLGFSAEAGYTSSGDMTAEINSSANGVWINALVIYKISTKVSYINRLGFDFGDANFTMMGMGAEYAVDKHITMRSEVVMRGDFKSYQLNLLYQF